MRILRTALTLCLAAVAGAFSGTWAWVAFDPLGIVEFEGRENILPLGAWLVNSLLVIPFYLPWIALIEASYLKITAEPISAFKLAITSSFLIAGVGQLHPFDFFGHLHGVGAYLVTMLIMSVGLLGFPILWRRLQRAGVEKQQS